ncbi:MAG: hypothetical protein M3Q36_00515 [bacterium]|nr:hypothetical protein [bacterium]
MPLGISQQTPAELLTEVETNLQIREISARTREILATHIQLAVAKFEPLPEPGEIDKLQRFFELTAHLSRNASIGELLTGTRVYLVENDVTIPEDAPPPVPSY